MSEEKTVRFGYSSSANISMVGTVDSGIRRDDWDAMSEEEQNEETSNLVHELIELFELGDDEPDYHGRWR